MRTLAVVALCVGVTVPACGPDAHVSAALVQWMDWPAEIAPGTPFSVRLIVLPPSCVWDVFGPGTTVDQSAVTFAPYFGGVREDVLCAGALFVGGGLDTLVTAPGLPAASPRAYEVRAATSVNSSDWRLTNLTVRTFGEIIVQPPTPGASVRNAAGYVWPSTDTLGCLRLTPTGAFTRDRALVLENPVDTAGIGGAFVKGYIYDVATPICGETHVFHLVSRN